MEAITFERMPEAIGIVLSRLENIEALLGQKQLPAKSIEDQILTIEEAAALIKLSKNTIYNLVSSAVIPYSKKGKRLYFSKKELMAWLMSGRRKTRREIAAAL